MTRGGSSERVQFYKQYIQYVLYEICVIQIDQN